MTRTVSTFIDVDQLQELLGELVLPPNVRKGWTDWFRRHRSVELTY